MKQYPVWLTEFGCALVVAAILNALIYESGNGIAFGFGLLILVVMGARRIFERGERSAEND